MLQKGSLHAKRMVSEGNKLGTLHKNATETKSVYAVQQKTCNCSDMFAEERTTEKSNTL